MNIAITGITGFIGSHLAAHLAKNNHNIIGIGRDAQRIKTLIPDAHAYSWDTLTQYPERITPAPNVVIHLAGANISQKRWTKKFKKELLSSRVNTTQMIGQYCSALPTQPHLLNASALSIYGLFDTLQDPHTVSENTTIQQHSSFLSQLAYTWEDTLIHSYPYAENRSILRFSLVLGNGGLLKKLIPQYQYYLGGIMGNGQQPFAWIALCDAIKAITYAIDHHITGPINIVSPTPTTQHDMNNALSTHLKKKTIWRYPTPLVKTLLGKMGDELLLKGIQGHPDTLLNHDFVFDSPSLITTLQHYS